MTWPLLVLILISTPAVEVPSARYEVSLESSPQHRVIVVATYPCSGLDQLELWMPVWTPGSYKIRDYARHIEQMEAFDSDGTSLEIERPSKNCWNIETGGRDSISVRYHLYCRILSVRTNFIEAGSGFLNGAATFLLPRQVKGPFEITFKLPAEIEQVVTALSSDGKGTYTATDVDQLCDSPIIFGDPVIRDFEVEEVPHSLVNLGGEDLWDADQCAEDVEKICEEIVRFWGEIPYSSYKYLNVIAEGGGGLEHMDCTLMLTGRWTWGDEDRRKSWFGLVSHEQFHAWNGKRLRPEALGPFEYEREVFTPDLWFVEGFTSYYDDLLIARAGLIEQKEYLERIGKQIKEIQQTPGRLVLPLSAASTDAWIRYYQRDENSINSQISYYTKGAMVAWLLDARIRSASNHQRSLDDAMRLAFRKFSGERGYTHQDLLDVFEEIAGTDLSEWYGRFIDGTDELEYEEALEVFGLRFQPQAEVEESKKPGGWLGIEASESAGKWTVSRVRVGTPAFDAGLNPGDEIIAIGSYRLGASRWKQVRRQHPPGSSAELLISRRGALRTLTVTFAEDPLNPWKIHPDPEASEEAKARLASWLGSAGSQAQEKEADKAEDPSDSDDSGDSGR